MAQSIHETILLEDHTKLRWIQGRGTFRQASDASLEALQEAFNAWHSCIFSPPPQLWEVCETRGTKGVRIYGGESPSSVLLRDE